MLFEIVTNKVGLTKILPNLHAIFICANINQ